MFGAMGVRRFCADDARQQMPLRYVTKKQFRGVLKSAGFNNRSATQQIQVSIAMGQGAETVIAGTRYILKSDVKGGANA